MSKLLFGQRVRFVSGGLTGYGTVEHIDGENIAVVVDKPIVNFPAGELTVIEVEKIPLPPPFVPEPAPEPAPAAEPAPVTDVNPVAN